MKKRIQIRHAVLTIPINSSSFRKDEELFNYLKKTNIFSYFIFQREFSESKKEHWQCYLEFSKPQDISKIRGLFTNAHVEPRYGSQAAAISYCSKKKSRINPPLSYGKKKRSYATVKKQSDPDIPTNSQEQKVYIIQKIRNQEYKTLEDVYKVFPLLEWADERKLKNLLYKYNPQPVLDAESIPTIWLYGESGAGKTTWGKRFLKSQGYTNRDVCRKKASHKNDKKLWFQLEDENKKVLWIEEVRTDFPNKNELIIYIDGADPLPVKSSQIRNNFKLIILNSLLPPWEVYRVNEIVSLEEKKEVLRRLFDGQIIEVTANTDSLTKCNQLNGNQFTLCYQPYTRMVANGKDKQLYKEYLSSENFVT